MEVVEAGGRRGGRGSMALTDFAGIEKKTEAEVEIENLLIVAPKWSA